MVKPIIRDILFLGLPSLPATSADVGIDDDLLDTLKANSEKCVGMAANMIGERVRIIVFDDNGGFTEMFNPEIIKKDGAFSTDEGCLSLDGMRSTKRYKTIKVRWQTREFTERVKSYGGWTAQIIQHEIDHCNGIII